VSLQLLPNGDMACPIWIVIPPDPSYSTAPEICRIRCRGDDGSQCGEQPDRLLSRAEMFHVKHTAFDIPDHS